MNPPAHRVLLGLLLIGLLCWFVKTETPSLGQTNPVASLKPVSYAALSEVVRAHKGKVVVVDVWASW